MIRRAQANLARNQLPFALLRGYAQFLPLETNSLDCVVATFPSEYIADRLTLAEIKRTLKPSGRLVIVPMAWIWGKSLTDRAMKWLFRVTGQTEELSPNFEGKIESLLTRAGFGVEIIYTDIRHTTVSIIIAETIHGEY